MENPFLKSVKHYCKKLEGALANATTLPGVVDISQLYPANLEEIEKALHQNIECRTIVASYAHDLRIAFERWSKENTSLEEQEDRTNDKAMLLMAIDPVEDVEQYCLEAEDGVKEMDVRIHTLDRQKSQIMMQNAHAFYSHASTPTSSVQTQGTPASPSGSSNNGPGPSASGSPNATVIPTMTSSTVTATTVATTTTTTTASSGGPQVWGSGTPGTGSNAHGPYGTATFVHGGFPGPFGNFGPSPFTSPFAAPGYGSGYGSPHTMPPAAYYPSVHNSLPAHLPELKLLDYFGESTKWQTWWQSYEAAVHNQPLSNALKFTYLLSAVKGSAKAAIENIAPRDDTYETAVAILKETFGNEKIVVQSLFHELEKIPQAGNSTTSIRNVYNRVECILRQLEAMSQSVNDTYLGRMVEMKFPSWIHKEIYKEQLKNPRWCLKDTRELVKDRLLMNEAIEKMRPPTESSHPNQGDQSHGRPYDKRQKHAYAATTQRPVDGNFTKGSIRRKCAFCGFDHWSDQCKKFASFAERNETVREKRLCYLCLRANHQTKDCTSKVYCYYCEGRHSRAMCKKRKDKPVEPNSFPKGRGQNKPGGFRPANVRRNAHATTTSTEEDAEEEEDEDADIEENDPQEEEQRTKYAHAYAAHREKNTVDAPVFLLTTETEVRGSGPAYKSDKCGILLDPGADTCLVTNELATKLKLEVIRQDNLSLGTVHNGDKSSFESTIYKMGIRERDGNFKQIYAYGVDSLLEALPHLQKLNSRKFKQSLVLPQVLIGANFAFEFITQIGRKLPEGIYEVQTTFGPLLTGVMADDKHVVCAALNTEKSVTCAAIRSEKVTDADKANIGDDEDTADDKRIKLHFALENIGVTEDSPYENDNQVAWDMYVNSLSRIEGRYYGSWPLKTPNPRFPNMLPLCFGRLKSLASRSTTDQLIAYDAVFKNYMKQDIMEVVKNPKEQLGPYVMYLPHHPVFKNTAGKTKVRPVLDCSAKCGVGTDSLNSPTTRLITMHTHSLLTHAEHGHVVNELRQNFRFSRMKQTVKGIIYQNCFECRKRKLKPFARPPMAMLPADRFEANRCWDSIACDNFGPVVTKNENGDHVKRYGMIFVCLKSRACHLEPLDSLTADECLGAITRFIARRATPRLVRSDNCSTYKSAAKHLSELWPDLEKDQVFSRFLAQHGIRWSFVTERAPYENGSAERLIGVVKKSLKASLGRKIITDSQYRSLLVSVEGITNSRPLTPVNSDLTCIRPLDLIGVSGAPGLPSLRDNLDSDPSYYPSFEYNREQAVAHWRGVLEMSQHYWSRFYQEYLTHVRDTYPFTHRDPKSKVSRSPMPGDICHVFSDECPKGAWPLAKILSFKQSRDNHIRAARIQVRDGTVMNRVVSDLYPMELQSSDEVTFQASEEPAEEPHTEHISSRTRQKLKRREVSEVSRQRAVQRQEATQKFALCTITKVSSISMRYPFYVLLFMGIIATTFAHKCPTGAYNLKRVASPICRTHGTAIYKYPSKPERFCYADIYCRAGHIQPLNASNECGSPCKCPMPWHSGCAFFEGKIKRNSTSTRGKIRRAFEALQPANLVSALFPSNESSHVIKLLPHVELYDGSVYVVPQLNLVHREVLTDHIVCFGNGATVGTPDYCKVKKCAKNGTRVCHIPHADAVFYQLPAGPVAIKGWGIKKATLIEGGNDADIIPWHESRLECSNDGAKLVLPHNASSVQVCEFLECHNRVNTSTVESFFLPPSTRIIEHNIDATVWYRGRAVAKLQTQCAAVSYCEEISFGIDLLRNPKCSPNMAAVIYLILTYLACIVILTLARACLVIFTAAGIICSTGLCLSRIVHKVVRCISSGTCLPLKCVIRAVQRMWLAMWRGEGAAAVVRRRRNVIKPLMFLTFAFAIMHLSEACTETRSIIAKEKACETDASGSLRCSFQETVLLTMQPKSPACLIMQDGGARPMGSFRARLKALFQQCNKRIKFTTRPFEIRVDSSKRCWGAGNTCLADTCAKIKPSSYIEELTPSMHLPGNSFCHESCGSILCGCWHLNPACLLYRFYGVPTNNETIQVFECLSYETVALIETELTLGTEKLTHIYQLTAGETENWANVKLTLTSVSTGQAPALSQTFVSNGREVGLPKGPLVETLTCTTTEFNNCTLPETFCRCHPSGEVATCTCHDETAYELKNSALLPQYVGGVWLSTDEGRVTAELPSTSAIIQVTLEGLSVQTEFEANTCSVADATVTGCFACARGSLANITCTTNFGTSLAVVQCESAKFTVLCKPEPEPEIIHLMFNKASINEHCFVRCASSDREFRLRGELTYVGATTEQGTTKSSYSWDPSTDYGIWAFLSGFIFAFNKLYLALGALLLLVILGFTAYCAFTIYCPCLAILRRARKFKTHIVVVAVVLLSLPPCVHSQEVPLGNSVGGTESESAEQLVSVIIALLAILNLLRPRRNVFMEWLNTYTDDYKLPQNAKGEFQGLFLEEFIDQPELLAFIKRRVKNKKQLLRRLKRRKATEKTRSIKRHRRTHCCRAKRCRKGYTCKGDKLVTSSDEESDSEYDYSNTKTCLCNRCYTGDESRIKGGPFFGLYLAIILFVAMILAHIDTVNAGIIPPKHDVLVMGMRNQRPTYGSYQPKPRFNNMRSQQQRYDQPQEYGWTSLLRQMKLEHENCTDNQLAKKLTDPAIAEKALHVLRCRKVSAPGHIRMRVIEGWDGPADATKSVKDPSKTILEWYRDHGLEIRCDYLPVLVVKEDANADAEQIPLEHLDVEAPIIRVKREALPWMRKDAARPLNGGLNSNNATSGSPPIATTAQPTELAAILGELAELKSKVEDKKSVKKSELKKLQADADEKGKKLKAAESSVDQLRSLLQAFKQANPKAVLPEGAVLDRIIDESEKPTEISGSTPAHSSPKKLTISTGSPEKTVKPTPTSS